MLQKGEKQNDRDRNPEKPKQNTTTHDTSSCRALLKRHVESEAKTAECGSWFHQLRKNQAVARGRIIFAAGRNQARAGRVECWQRQEARCAITPENIMSSTTDKIKGVANQVAGSVKQSVGSAVGSTKTEAEGAMQKVKGQAQEAAGKAKDAVKIVIDKA